MSVIALINAALAAGNLGLAIHTGNPFNYAVALFCSLVTIAMVVR
jgi:hypothetical protein